LSAIFEVFVMPPLNLRPRFFVGASRLFDRCVAVTSFYFGIHLTPIFSLDISVFSFST
jgi:hypothetical protein